MSFILINEACKTKGEFMNTRLETGKLYFIGLKADINGDHYLIIKNNHENMVGTIIKKSLMNA